MAETPSDPIPLSDLQHAKAIIVQLKGEVINLRSTLNDREARLAAIELSREREALSAEFITATGGNAQAGDLWNWTTMRVQHPAPPAAKDQG
jgi:hypothetical protein